MAFQKKTYYVVKYVVDHGLGHSGGPHQHTRSFENKYVAEGFAIGKGRVQTVPCVGAEERDKHLADQW